MRPARALPLRLGLLLLLLLVLPAPAAAMAGAGDLDSGFGDGGIVQPELGEGAFGAAVTVDDTGRTIETGYVSAGSGTDVLVARHLPNGALDPSFADGGIATIPVNAEEVDFDAATGVIALPDGGILVGGVSGSSEAETSYHYLFFLCFGEGGSLDEAFGQGGAATLFPEDTGAPLGIGRDERGRIMAAAPGYDGPIATRVGPGGDPADYGDDGIVDLDRSLLVDAAAFGRHGGVVMAGWNGRERPVVYRVDPRGRFDTGFGVRRLPIGEHGRVGAMAIDRRGRIVVAGSSRGGSGGDVEVVRLLPGGRPDPRFGRGGRRTVALDGLRPNGVSSVLLAGHRRIVVTASTNDGALAAVRFTRNGRLDREFGRRGTARASVEGRSVELTGAALGPDGSVTAIGNTPRGSGVVLARWRG